MVIVDRWPLFGLRLRTPRLELRLPTLDQLAALADLAAEGIHDPDTMPFGIPWTDAPPDQRARGTLQWHWRKWADWSPERWNLNLVALADGVVVGTQDVAAIDFVVTREVRTGSWLGRRFQGQGLGTHMRAAVLHLAFDGLAAEYATSGAFTDNAASLGVSRRLGYADDGIERQERRGRPATQRRLRLDRERWQAHRTVPVEITGLEPCLPMFGLDRAAG
jgi:RimJ/RimL family protein N-acetyltransferase